ncbi:MAG: ABC transporter ATPase [Flavobacteriales bacterium]|nr:ABC transporter ATPase [Flavobacteriales bacterium]
MRSFDSLSGESRIWIYQSNRKFSAEENSLIESSASDFVNQWSAHGAMLEASIKVFHDLFVVVAVDENHAGATGCSIDKSFKFVSELEERFGVKLLDRMVVAYYDGDLIVNCSLSDFENKIANKECDANTLVFNNLIETKSDLEANWVNPIKDSWQARLLG